MPHCDYCYEGIDYDNGPIVEIRAVYGFMNACGNKSTIIKLAHYKCWRGVDKIPGTM
jgi:hypothetical protein